MFGSFGLSLDALSGYGAASESHIRRITEFIFVQSAPRPLDLALVLGSPTISSLVPAVDFYRAGLVPKLLIAGHGRPEQAIPEWKLYLDEAVARGVDRRDILLERRSTNTLENIRGAARIIADEIGWDRVGRLGLFCKPLHARRALLTARTHLPADVDLSVHVPRAAADIQADDWWTTERSRERVLGEVRRIADYAAKGDLRLQPLSEP